MSLIDLVEFGIFENGASIRINLKEIDPIKIDSLEEINEPIFSQTEMSYFVEDVRKSRKTYVTNSGKVYYSEE